MVIIVLSLLYLHIQKITHTTLMFLTGGSKKIAWNVMSKKGEQKKNRVKKKKTTNHHCLHAALLMVLENTHKKQQTGADLQK